jgi:anti-sigma factor RsiW
MSLSQTELIYLMAYVDDQVDDDELPEVTALLARSEEARQLVAQHAAFGDAVRASSDARAVAAGADAIAGQVLGEIDRLGGGKVIAIETERARLALNRQRVKEFSALIAVAAVAAAFWLMPASKPDVVAVAPPPSAKAAAKKSIPAPPRSAVASAVDPAAGSASAAEADGPNVDVESVESPSHPFSIFYVPPSPGMNPHASSVVVWISE